MIACGQVGLCPSLDSNNITVQNPHQENREIYEKLIAAKDEQIALLKNLLETK